MKDQRQVVSHSILQVRHIPARIEQIISDSDHYILILTAISFADGISAEGIFVLEGAAARGAALRIPASASLVQTSLSPPLTDPTPSRGQFNLTSQEGTMADFRYHQKLLIRAPYICSLLLAPLLAQFDPGRELNQELAKKTSDRLQLRFELKQRAENRTGMVFGRDRDLAADFVRTRVGFTATPVSWFKASVLAQDTRAPFYGLPAPGNVRDPFDIQEAYVELFSKKQQGAGITLGRQMINYGDARLIGSPQWAYTARTWDTARLYHVTKKIKLEFLALATIVPRGDRFNRPVLGDRIWGTYNTFRELLGKEVFDIYILRHDQNFPGGFIGPGTLGINLYGSRWAVPLPHSFRITVEGILQNGKVGLLPHRAAGGVVQLGYRTTARKKTLDFANEYKYASGTDPRSGHSGTFDQLYPAAHDKFGHVDILGWRNIHNLKSATTLNISKTWNWVLMYNSSWLANPRDAVYNGQGRAIVRSANGTAGRYIGQELDLYTNYQWGGLTISAGLGQFVPGTFIKNTTPGAHSRLIYLSTSYSF